MKTTKPIATISYNSEGFLLGVLDRLISTQIISFYCFIRHEPEEDENKAHIHLYLEPASSVDTLWLQKQFLEPDKENPNHPLGVMPIGKSKWVDWYWYGLHDKAYLASKNMSRKHHYEGYEMITSDTEYLAEKVRTNPNPKAELLKVIELMMKGYKPLQIAVQMNIATRNLGYFLTGLKDLRQHLVDVTDRNGVPNHEGAFYLEGEKDDEND